jgi:hypothetical protein
MVAALSLGRPAAANGTALQTKRTEYPFPERPMDRLLTAGSGSNRAGTRLNHQEARQTFEVERSAGKGPKISPEDKAAMD